MVRGKDNDGTSLGFVLVDVLGSFKLGTCPIILDHHSTKVLPRGFPSLRGLGAFIVTICSASGRGCIFLSDSVSVPSLGVLPPSLSIGRTHVLSPARGRRGG